MNDRLPYETLIAGKLEALPPLPAMADAIWSRISDELDNEMPTDDAGSGNAGPGSASGGAYLWPGIGLLLLVVAGLVFWNKQKDAPAFIPTTPIDSNAVAAPPASEGPLPPGGHRENEIIYQEQLPAAVADSSSEESDMPSAGQSTTLSLDSTAAVESKTVLDVQKSVGNKIEETPGAAIKSMDSPAVKKPRGVTGIDQKEYRIVPGKKDSTKKN